MLVVETRQPLEFVDLTDAIAAAVQDRHLIDGIVSVQTRHTTTGILINEHEPLLLLDLAATFERAAPDSRWYEHDDFARRRLDLGAAERRNGHAHCRAALLRTSESVPVNAGCLMLGRWQRVFLVDFDGGQRRQVSLTLMGALAHESEKSDRG
jgi:secondary thiamine-phosphate synthase enzyme